MRASFAGCLSLYVSFNQMLIKEAYFILHGAGGISGGFPHIRRGSFQLKMRYFVGVVCVVCVSRDLPPAERDVSAITILFAGGREARAVKLANPDGSPADRDCDRCVSPRCRTRGASRDGPGFGAGVLHSQHGLRTKHGAQSARSAPSLAG